jgi:hypothetical protein
MVEEISAATRTPRPSHDGWARWTALGLLLGWLSWTPIRNGWRAAAADLAPIRMPEGAPGQALPASAERAAPGSSRALSVRALSLRDLRTLPGVGERRALQIARARWAWAGSPDPLFLDQIPGIGPKTAAAVVQALRGDPAPAALPGRAATLNPAPASRQWSPIPP